MTTGCFLNHNEVTKDSLSIPGQNSLAMIERILIITFSLFTLIQFSSTSQDLEVHLPTLRRVILALFYILEVGSISTFTN